MNKNGILWTVITCVSGLVSAGLGIVTGVATQKAIAANTTQPTPTPVPEAPVCPPETN